MVRCVIVIAALVTWANGQQFNPPLGQGRPQTQGVSVPAINPNDINAAFETANANIQRRNQEERNSGAFSRTLGGRVRGPEARHHLLQSPRPRTTTLETNQLAFEEATRIVAQGYSLTPEQVAVGLANTTLTGRTAAAATQQCNAQFEVRCQDSRYRSADGTCNNLANPSWGRASVCFQRLLSPAYSDGISQMRRAATGRELPTPREISLRLHATSNRPTESVTHMIMAYGQFLDHDISLTPFSTTLDNDPIMCCPVIDDNNVQCAPILLRPNDPFFSNFGTTCLNFVRSSPCPLCVLGPRQQTNQVTGFIDGSMIYGNSINETNGLRTMAGDGRLRTTEDSRAGSLLPPSPDPNNDQCSIPNENEICFLAGDQRVNQHPTLTSLHTLFLREHNRIAAIFRNLNPSWDGERIFQEARRIIGAQLQMITYREFLPPVLGDERMNFFGLRVREAGFTEYDASVEPTLINEFSTAAYRFGHSMVDTLFREIPSSRPEGGERLRDTFFYPFELYREGIAPHLRGFSSSPAQRFDRYMVPDVTNHLYQERGNASGLDLASFNIQRGRDHGLQGYINYMRACGGPRVRRFGDLDRVMPVATREMLQDLYESVEDIDLFTGGLAERPIAGITGPTFTCILGIQFYHLKYGDRYFFEHYGQSGSFSQAQLAELRKVTLGKVMCDNTDVLEIQPEVMRAPSNRNRVVPCSNLPEMDLEAWRE